MQHVTANALNSTATVHNDESRVTLAQLQEGVKDCGYICAGEAAPEPMGPSRFGPARANNLRACQPPKPDKHARSRLSILAADRSAQSGKPGMRVEEIELDMRIRFFILQVLTVPIFVFSHLATQILSRL